MIENGLTDPNGYGISLFQKIAASVFGQELTRVARNSED
jgi:hypothetical protein